MGARSTHRIIGPSQTGMVSTQSAKVGSPPKSIVVLPGRRSVHASHGVTAFPCANPSGFRATIANVPAGYLRPVELRLRPPRRAGAEAQSSRRDRLHARTQSLDRGHTPSSKAG